MSCWIDAHVHAFGETDSLEMLQSIERHFGYDTANFLSVEGMGDAAQNALAIGWKLLDGRHYAFGGLHHRFAYDYAEEMRTLYAIGFDGMKMIENKPTQRKRLGIAQNDPSLDAMYAAAEEIGIPFLIHVNDPKEFWDNAAIPDWARNAGYFYGADGFTGYEQILSESLAMCEKHPKLRVCFAHFLFLSDDHDRLRRIMDAHENLMLDVTAGTEMYPNFSRDVPLWRRFFADYADRILYGTDNCAPMRGEDVHIAEVLNGLERAFFGSDGAIPLWDGTVFGLGLPEAAVQKLTHDNFRRFAGDTPRAIDCAAAAAYLEKRLSDPRYRLTEAERAVTANIQKECLRRSSASSIL